MGRGRKLWGGQEEGQVGKASYSCRQPYYFLKSPACVGFFVFTASTHLTVINIGDGSMCSHLCGCVQGVSACLCRVYVHVCVCVCMDVVCVLY